MLGGISESCVLRTERRGPSSVGGLTARLNAADFRSDCCPLTDWPLPYDVIGPLPTNIVWIVFRDNHRIEHERVVTDVVKIELQFFNRVLVAFPVGIIHLRPTGDARLNEMAEMIKWNLLVITIGALNPFRSRANQADFAAKNVPELREFIDTKLSQKPAKR